MFTFIFILVRIKFAQTRKNSLNTPSLAILYSCAMNKQFHNSNHYSNIVLLLLEQTSLCRLSLRCLSRLKSRSTLYIRIVAIYAIYDNIMILLLSFLKISLTYKARKLIISKTWDNKLKPGKWLTYNDYFVIWLRIKNFK